MKVTSEQLNFLDRIANMTPAALRAELSRAHMQIERLQDVAFFESNDIVDRARREGVNVKVAREMGRFTREFIRKAWH